MMNTITRALLATVLFAGIQLIGCGASRAATPEPVCIQCHDKQPGRLGAPVAAWRTSVHAANGISCNDCHGGDPSDLAMAMSPERGFLGVPRDVAIPAFCGRCHVGVREDYLGSAHGHALGRGGPQCVTCHGDHGVQRATPELINEKDCTRCHTFERARIIKAAMTDTDRQITELERSLADLKKTGVVTREMDGDLFAVRNRFHRLFHSVEVEKVRSQTAGFHADLAKIRDRVTAIRMEHKRRKIWGGSAVVILLCCSVIALFIYRGYRKEI